MRLLRLGPIGAERPALAVDADRYVPVDDIVADIDGDTLSRLDELTPAFDEAARTREARPIRGQRIGAPIARPHQILCIGLNYRDHAAETGQAVPDEPILFSKSPNTLVGPNDDVVMPRAATKLDWEVELGIVIGRRAFELDSPAQAEAAIAGYVLVNDVSERAFQLERGGQWMKGKCAPTFNPAGPWLVTRDDLDVSALPLRLAVNDLTRQDGSTATMIFTPVDIVLYLSQFLALEPGDLINTGTPPGVGMGQHPPVYLAVGDRMRLWAPGLGEQSQTVVAAR